jgi:5,10-methylenetetrahydrofolate reductase
MRQSAECPKHMEFGPCGGVRADGACEVDVGRCTFVDQPLRRWPTDAAAPGDRGEGGDTSAVAMVVTDVRPRDASASAVREIVDLYGPWADVVLVGDHHETVDLPASLVAGELTRAGLRTWATLSCRDRNRVALESELAAFRALGVETVHCVTGDIRAPHVRPGSRSVFDLDALRLVALASSLGVRSSVAEAPAAPPQHLRVARALDKHLAGASTCFVNLTADAALVAEFADQLHRRAPALELIVCVPVFTDAEGAQRLRSLPGVGLGDAEVERVLSASDPVRAGVDRAIHAARAVLDLPGVAGVNLSGPASTAGPGERAQVLRHITEELR